MVWVHREAPPRMSLPARYVSTFELRFVVLDTRLDWPVVQILVDGREAFTDQFPGWQGFDPADMLGDRSPLLPEEPGRRVAVYRCSCGIEGCGVVAPVIVPSPDGRRVSWVDFRDYVGVFVGPTAHHVDHREGRAWPIQDLHFDRGQYAAEIRRASANQSWETPRRATARLAADGLRTHRGIVPPDLVVGWVSPAWDDDGIQLSLERAPSAGEPFQRQVLSLNSPHTDPEAAAHDIIEQLRAVPADQWPERYG
jgi:hypothetical protein